MECLRHGLQKSSCICQHLQYGRGIGFFEPKNGPDAEWLFKNVWSAKYEAIAVEQGGWNDFSERNAQIMPICEGRFEES